jgi:hypothetical protein
MNSRGKKTPRGNPPATPHNMRTQASPAGPDRLASRRRPKKPVLPKVLPVVDPKSWPSDLWSQAEWILRETQRQTLPPFERSSQIICEMTPALAEDVRFGARQTDDALHAMDRIWERLREFDPELLEIEKIRTSRQWLVLAKAIEDSQRNKIKRCGQEVKYLGVPLEWVNDNHPEGPGAQNDTNTRSRAANIKSRAAARQSVLGPICDEKSLTIGDWRDRTVDKENKVPLSYDTVYDYWTGKTIPYRRTRKRLASGLGIDLKTLPK